MISTTVPPTTLDISGLATTADLSTLATAANLATVDTVVDAIKAVTDNLPNSGALTNLDVAVSSVKDKGQANLVRETAWTTVAVFAFANETQGYGDAYTTGTLDIAEYPATPLLSLTAAGWLYLVVTYRNASFSSGTLSTRITIDGDVWDVVTDSASTTQYAGHVALGVGPGGSGVITPLRVRFNTSLKVEVASSVAQTSGKATSRIMYSLDT